MPTLLEVENRSTLSRVTSGWKKKELPIEWVRKYWRDVHSPAIARRAGIYDYRHSQFDAVRTDILTPIAGVGYECPPDQQLMWLSDVRYLDDNGLDMFGLSPDGEAKAQLLGDIDLIVDQSTTYKVVGANARTLIDNTGTKMPQGVPAFPSFAFFFRQKGDEASFRKTVEALAEKWAVAAGVVRVRLNLYDVPDMEAERKAGYPIKTHPVERQYQAWIELWVESEVVTKTLISDHDDVDYAAHITEIHAYPVLSHYTFNYSGRPTLVGLRGYAAYEALEGLKGQNQREPILLTWMYGAAVNGGPIVEGNK